MLNKIKNFFAKFRHKKMEPTLNQRAEALVTDGIAAFRNAASNLMEAANLKTQVAENDRNMVEFYRSAQTTAQISAEAAEAEAAKNKEVAQRILELIGE